VSDPQPPAQSEPQTGGYVGNSNSMKFHRADCPWAAKIAPANRVVFKSREEAVAGGYQPCKVCCHKAMNFRITVLLGGMYL